jgi:hypothetical protein
MACAPPDFEFGNEDQHEPTNFTFYTTFTPGNDEMLVAMRAILNPAWSQTMMMPGSVVRFAYTFLVTARADS